MSNSTFFPTGRRCTAMILLGCAMCFASLAAADGAGRRPSALRDDPCGLPDTSSPAYRIAAALNWGYGYDSLKASLARWALSPFVQIDSVGASVLNRTLYMMTIQDTAVGAAARKRVWIHARTHPIEVQGTWVTNQIITQLLGPSDFARQMRSACVFNIIPMINPDGVELKRSRENAHNIDIESNWTAVPGEPEVQTLRRMFAGLMQTPNPIRIALNMHSAYGTVRYFVYHTATGTSSDYATTEQHFINSVRSYFPGGIQPYDFFVSWTTSPSLVYPESWFWQNCRENVLALTYEDMNDASARAFDSTAIAILHGIADELGVNGSTDVPAAEIVPAAFSLEQNYPNPFNPLTHIGYSIGVASGQSPVASHVRLVVFDVLGREVSVLVDGKKEPGLYEAAFDGTGLASGVYFCRMEISGSSLASGHGFVQTRKLLLMR